MGRAVTRTHRGLPLHVLYPLGSKVPGLRRVPATLRRTARRRLTGAAVRVHGRRCRGVSLAAITGSRGKTTAKDILAEMLAPAGTTVKTRQNDNDVYGVPASLLAVRPDDRFAVLEVGIRDAPGEMAWMAGLLRPDVVLHTGVATEHLAAFGTRQRLADEKRLLLARLSPDGTAVLNADDELAREAAGALRCRVVLAGLADDADVRLTGAELAWPHGMDVELTIGGRRLRGRVEIHGLHLAPLVALAAAAAEALGVPAEEALRGAGGFAPPPGRMQPAPGPDGSTVLLDDAMSRLQTATASLAAFGELPAQRRVAVLGELQEADQTPDAYRPLVEPLCEHADLLVAVGRSGAPLRELLQGTSLGARMVTVDGIEDAARALEGELGEGDLVLLHGANGQHLQRVKLLLDEHPVHCRVRRCTLHWRCTECPWLEATPPPTVVEAA
jgi:UDP-N-acetylmuramoyl-tripeptide--D-alanyl-D-alanine ligase